MTDQDTKFCPHCRVKYQTILDTCVYCNGHMRTVSVLPGGPEILFVVVNLTVILLFFLIALK